MTISPDEHYNAEFYETNVPGMSRSAETVLGLLYDHYKPGSVIDVGCGRGAWLAAAERLGAKLLRGLDGPWVSSESLLSDSISFTPVDFEEALPELTQRYDLCISLEVAEHISQARAERFVEYLCRAADVVLFGAAIKHQGGANHINEQWQSYWRDIFRSKRYECLDIIRPGVWNESSVEWWYRQNTFLFVRADLSNGLLHENDIRHLQQPIFDIVHPANYERKIRFYESQVEHPTLHFCLRCLKHYVRNKLSFKNPST